MLGYDRADFMTACVGPSLQGKRGNAGKKAELVGEGRSRERRHRGSKGNSDIGGGRKGEGGLELV